MPVTGAVNAEHSGRMRQQVVSNVWDWLDIRGGQDCHLRCFVLLCIRDGAPQSVFRSKMALRTTESVQADNLKPPAC
jgi:hypothetical protein